MNLSDKIQKESVDMVETRRQIVFMLQHGPRTIGGLAKDLKRSIVDIQRVVNASSKFKMVGTHKNLACLREQNY